MGGTTWRAKVEDPSGIVWYVCVYVVDRSSNVWLGSCYASTLGRSNGLPVGQHKNKHAKVVALPYRSEQPIAFASATVKCCGLCILSLGISLHLVLGIVVDRRRSPFFEQCHQFCIGKIGLYEGF